MTTGHLVPHLELALVGDENLGQFDDARGQLVTDGHLELLPLEGAEQVVVLQVVVVNHALDEGVVALIPGPTVGVDDAEVERLKGTLRELHTLLDLHLLVVVLHALGGLAADDLHQLLHEGLAQCCSFLVEFSVNGLEDGLVGRLGLAVLDHAGEQHLVDDDSAGARSEFERCVLDVSGLVTEDGAEELLLRAGIALPFRRDLADEDVPGTHVGTDADQAVLVEILGGLLADVRDVRGQLLLAALGVADLEAVLGHVEGGEHVLADHALADDDGVLEVVSLPRHEGDLHVLAERELAGLRGVTLHHDVALFDPHALRHDGLQIDAGALVRLGELGDVVDLDVVLEGDEAVILIHLVPDVDLVCGLMLDNTIALGRHQHAAVSGHLALESRAHDRAVRTHQRHGLAHHVRSHQRPVGVVIL